MISLILVAGLLLRLISLDQSFWLDEATSALVVKNFTFTEILTRFIKNDFHPPLYYLTLKAWSGPFGISEVSLRMLSVFLALGSVFLIYLIASEMFNKKIGLLSAAFLSINGLHVYYSQEVRMYMMSTFLVSLLVYSFRKTIKNNHSLFWYVFSIALAANFLTDYLPNLILIAFWIFALINIKNKKWWKFFLFAHIPTVIAFFAWLPVLKKQIELGYSVKTGSQNWFRVLGKTNLKEILLVPVKFVFGRITFENKTLYFLVFGAGVLFVIWIIFGLRKKFIENKNIQVISLWLFVPIILSASIGLYISVFSYFRLLFVLPAFTILVALGVDRLKAKTKNISILIFMGIFLASCYFYLFRAKFHREDWRQMTSFIKSNSPEQNYSVIFSSNSQKEAYIYYNGYDDTVDAFYSKPDSDKVWFIKYVSDIFDPAGLAQKSVEKNGYHKVGEYSFNGVLVYEYENSN